MGLLLDLETQSGILVRNAYFRVDTINGNKDRISFSLNCYRSQQAFADGLSPIEVRQYNFTPKLESGSPNIFTQCYEHAKSMDGYRDAEDVLELS